MPGKVLKDLAGEPVLVRCVNRVRQANSIDEVIIATTIEPGDDAIVSLCDRYNIRWSRGSESDVLDRYYQSAKVHKPDIIVRVTSDCPLIEPQVIDRVVGHLKANFSSLAYVSNIIPTRTYPRGLDVEAFRFSALETAWNEATNDHERVHVTPFIWQQPKRFSRFCIEHEKDFSSHRWTLDTPEDYDLLQKICDHLDDGEKFSWLDVLGVAGQQSGVV